MGGNPLNRLADIDLPAPPDWQPLLTALGAAIVLAAALAWLAWRLWRHPGAPPPRQAAAQIDAVRRRWETGQIDDREASYRLASAIRLGLGMDQLDEHCPPALAAQAAQWRTIMTRLTALRYEPRPAARLRAEDFADLKTWLSAAGQTAEPRQAPSS